jgi:hypothetical protein
VSLTHLHGATKLSQVHPIGKRAQLLFTQARRRGILRTSAVELSRQTSSSHAFALPKDGSASSHRAPPTAKPSGSVSNEEGRFGNRLRPSQYVREPCRATRFPALGSASHPKLVHQPRPAASALPDFADTPTAGSRARLGGTRTTRGRRTLGEPIPRAAAPRASTRSGKVEAGDRVWRSKVPTHRRSREAASGRLSGPRHRHPGGHAFGVPSRGPAPCLPPPTRAHGSCASGSKAGKDRSPSTSNGRGSPSRSQQVLERKTQHPARRLIHRSAWRGILRS